MYCILENHIFYWNRYRCKCRYLLLTKKKTFLCPQNDRITKLKIDNNPFAKGFRACGQSKCKRKSTEPSDNAEPPSGESSEPKRPCSDAASSCSEEGSMRSSSPRSPPLIDSPTPVVPPPDRTPPQFYPDLPYMPPLHMPMPLGLWPAGPMPGFSWGPALPPPIEVPPPAAPAPVPYRRVKSFTISALLGEGWWVLYVSYVSVDYVKKRRAFAILTSQCKDRYLKLD